MMLTLGIITKVLNKNLQEIAKQPPSNTNININAEQMLIGDNKYACSSREIHGVLPLIVFSI